MYSGAEAAAAAANAIKASGAIVRVEGEVFEQLVAKERNPLIVTSQGGFLGKAYLYLMGYRGLVFFAKSTRQLMLPSGAELIQAAKIWMPGT